jgi:hypothetical protein
MSQRFIGSVPINSTWVPPLLVVAGRSNDTVPQNQPIPLGTIGRSVIVEGVTGGIPVLIQGAAAADAAQFGNPVLVAGADAAGTVQELPVADIAAAGPSQTLIVGGTDANAVVRQLPVATVGSGAPLPSVMIGGKDVSGNTQQFAVNAGVLSVVAVLADSDGISNTGAGYYVSAVNSAGALVVFPHIFNGTTWDRLRSGGATGILGIAGAVASGVAKAGNPVQIGSVFNTTQPTVTTGQVVESQATARGGLIVATGVDAFKVDILGNAGAVLDGVITVATAPANALATLSVNQTTAPSLAAGQSVALQSDYQGSVFVKPYRRGQTVSKATTIAVNTITTVLAAQAAGIFADISEFILTATPIATSVATTATLSDGTNSYIFDFIPGTATALGSDPIIFEFNPPLPAASAATAWTVTMSTANTVHITIVAVLQKAS